METKVEFIAIPDILLMQYPEPEHPRKATVKTLVDMLLELRQINEMHNQDKRAIQDLQKAHKANEQD